MRKWCGSLILKMQKEELKFGSYQKIVAHRVCDFQCVVKCGTRIAIKTYTIGSTNITNNTSDSTRFEKLVIRRGEYRCCYLLRTYFARQNSKCFEVGKEVHITFSNARKSFYCGSIKPFPMDETIGKLFDRYGYTFCHTDYIGKFKVDEAYIFGFDGCQYLFTFGLILLLCHGYICFLKCSKNIYNTVVPASQQKVSLSQEPELPAPQANLCPDEATTGTSFLKRTASVSTMTAAF